MLEDQVHVVWEWKWDEETDSDDCTQIDSAKKDSHINPYLSSDFEDLNKEDNTSAAGEMLSHTVTFKCIGTTHHPSAQDTLAKVSQMLEKDA